MSEDLTAFELERLNGAIEYLDKNGFHEPAISIRRILNRRALPDLAKVRALAKAEAFEEAAEESLNPRIMFLTKGSIEDGLLNPTPEQVEAAKDMYLRALSPHLLPRLLDADIRAINQMSHLIALRDIQIRSQTFEEAAALAEDSDVYGDGDDRRWAIIEALKSRAEFERESAVL